MEPDKEISLHKGVKSALDSCLPFSSLLRQPLKLSALRKQCVDPLNNSANRDLVGYRKFPAYLFMGRGTLF